MHRILKNVIINLLFNNMKVLIVMKYHYKIKFNPFYESIQDF